MKNFKKNQLSAQDLKDVKGGRIGGREFDRIICEETGGFWQAEFGRCNYPNIEL